MYGGYDDEPVAAFNPGAHGGGGFGGGAGNFAGSTYAPRAGFAPPPRRAAAAPMPNPRQVPGYQPMGYQPAPQYAPQPAYPAYEEEYDYDYPQQMPQMTTTLPGYGNRRAIKHYEYDPVSDTRHSEVAYDHWETESMTSTGTSKSARSHMASSTDGRRGLQAFPLTVPVEEARRRLKSICLRSKDTRVTKESAHHLRIETIAGWGHTDDIEFLISQSQGQIHVRAGSRVDRNDLGKLRMKVNKIWQTYTHELEMDQKQRIAPEVFRPPPKPVKKKAPLKKKRAPPPGHPPRGPPRGPPLEDGPRKNYRGEQGPPMPYGNAPPGAYHWGEKTSDYYSPTFTPIPTYESSPTYRGAPPTYEPVYGY